MTVVAMSHGEFSRFDTLSRVDRGELRVVGSHLIMRVPARRSLEISKPGAVAIQRFAIDQRNWETDFEYRWISKIHS
ncbi:hypothetical protein [Sphingobium sp.]|uniref:hypothetical protein n=1 Tax=Sphingobium sp. TaxID=1912891 RepID=UPI0035C72A4C